MFHSTRIRTTNDRHIHVEMNFERETTNFIRKDFCQICGDRAKFINYGALSCQSCKTFFRRYAFHFDNLRRCLFDQQCQMTIETRRNCSSCRLTKCLSVGMSVELIRKKDSRLIKRFINTSKSIESMNETEKELLSTFENYFHRFFQQKQISSISNEIRLFFNSNRFKIDEENFLLQQNSFVIEEFLTNCFLRRNDRRKNFDQTSISLLMIILLFSSNSFLIQFDENCSTTFSPIDLFHRQNRYVDLLWKDLSNRFNLEEIIRRISQFIKILLFIIKRKSSVVFFD